MKKLLFSLTLAVVFISLNAQTILFEDDFESYTIDVPNTGDGTQIPGGYTSYDVDGNGYNWGLSNPDFWTQPMGDIYTGNYMISATYLQSGESINADNILVLPVISVPAGATNITLNYYIGSGTDTSYFAETYDVIVTTENSQAAILAATPVFSETLPSQGGFNRTVNLDDYAGQDIYISFYHTDSYDNWILGLDDISVTAEGGGEPSDYCEVSLNCSDFDVIYNVEFAGIDNSSDCSPNGYGDYTSLTPAEVVAGETYTLSVEVGDGWFERVSAWIDFNDNGQFDTDEFLGEIGEGSDIGGVLLSDIEIPATVANGTYRMRILVYATGSSNPAMEDPCINDPAMYGEYEDYMVTVGEMGVTDVNRQAIAIYPNPVTDSFNVDLSSKFNTANVTVTVTDLTGKTVRTFGIADSYNVSELPKGIYVVKITDGKNTETKKIVKK